MELGIESSDEEWNLRVFDALSGQRTEIEGDFGEQLEWNLVEGRKKCYVKRNLSSGGYRSDKTSWPQIQDSMIEAMIRLEGAFKGPLGALSP